MDIFLFCLLFAGIYALYNALRVLNNNIIDKTEAIRKVTGMIAKYYRSG